MRILYISFYTDKKYFEKIFNDSLTKPLQSIQKFNNLMITGLSKDKQVQKIDIITNANINRSNSKRLFWKGKNVNDGIVDFSYLPFINIKFLKQICLLFFSIFYILSYCIKNRKNNCVFLVDGFYPIVSTVSTIFGKIFSKTIITFYTDLPRCSAAQVLEGQTVSRKIVNTVINLEDIINIKLSDMFILLTEEMNRIVNKKDKPYIIIEGLVDSSYEVTKPNIKKTNAIMYAGGLYEKYGVKLLIDSFVEWNNYDYELWLCGTGDLDKYVKELKNDKVKYLGVVPNKQVLEKERQCMLLVNPRFTNEEYTKYSFPSKNMEYMLSGTAVLTTHLPGMPKEYEKYVYIIEDETIDGYKNIFDKILINNNELDKKGKEAQDFVLKNKNNIKQAKKILDFIEKNKE